jgi:hypothetical protein
MLAQMPEGFPADWARVFLYRFVFPFDVTSQTALDGEDLIAVKASE